MVATQDLFASYLGEQCTGGFVIHNLRAYWQATQRTSSCYRPASKTSATSNTRNTSICATGFGTFQPGMNFYFGTKISY